MGGAWLGKRERENEMRLQKREREVFILPLMGSWRGYEVLLFLGFLVLSVGLKLKGYG